MTYGHAFLVAAAIMLSCYCQVENASWNNRRTDICIDNVGKTLSRIESKLNRIDSRIDTLVLNQFESNRFLIDIKSNTAQTKIFLESIKSESTKARIFLESIEFKMRQKDHEKDVKTQFANGKIGKK